VRRSKRCCRAACAASRFIADAWADDERARADRLATALEYKKHPAKSAPKEVRAKGKELADVRRELKRTRWVLALYEFHFPWLPEPRDFEEKISYVEGEPELEDVAANGEGGDVDPVQHWLARDEHAALSEEERNQRALDRYLASRKTHGRSAATTSAISATCASTLVLASPIGASSPAWKTSDATSSARRPTASR
jgi:hypothetical protein